MPSTSRNGFMSPSSWSGHVLPTTLMLQVNQLVDWAVGSLKGTARRRAHDDAHTEMKHGVRLVRPRVSGWLLCREGRRETPCAIKARRSASATKTLVICGGGHGGRLKFKWPDAAGPLVHLSSGVLLRASRPRRCRRTVQHRGCRRGASRDSCGRSGRRSS
jgi:hypothetical protein